MSRVWDTFMYNGEADMLELRLEQLEGKVHRHVLVESTVTHRGEPKTLLFPEQQHRFAKYADRIIYVPTVQVVPSDAQSDWGREHYQRDCAWEGFNDLAPDDFVLIADCDEIPSDTALAAEPPAAFALYQRVFHSAVDWEYPSPQLTSVIVRAGYIHWPDATLSKLRDDRYYYPALWDGGWHFSWLGTDEDRVKKLESTCHTEMSPEEYFAIAYGASYRSGEHHSPDATVQAVEVDETWPRAIYEHRCPASWFRPRGEGEAFRLGQGWEGERGGI